MTTLAIYPGSFDPLTNGHVDIISRGARLFDRIVVAILRNAEKSPLFTMDERVEITGTRGYARCNRISAHGLQEPAVVVYRDGETRSYHALPDRPTDAFAAMIDAGVAFFRTNGAPPSLGGPLLSGPLLSGVDAHGVLVALLAALDSSARGTPVDLAG